MKIGVLGAGNVGGTLGKRWASLGHEVYFGVRNPASEEMTTLLAQCGGHASAGEPRAAVEFADVVVCALPWAATKQTLSALDLNGKILLDCTNPLKADLSGLEFGTTTSGGEQVAGWARGAKVVKIFNTTGSGNMENPVYQGAGIPMFYCGDDAEAKKTAAKLAMDLGFAPMDAGSLANARLLEPYALLWIWLAFHGMGRDFAFRLVQRT